VVDGARSLAVGVGSAWSASGCVVGGGFDGAVVVGAERLAVAQAGDAAVVVGDDVIDVAAVCGFVAAGGVLAVFVAGLDDASEGAGEAAPRGGLDAPARRVVDDAFDVGVAEQRDQQARGDHGAGRRLAEP